jgi:hypothetical protein
VEVLWIPCPVSSKRYAVPFSILASNAKSEASDLRICAGLL